MKRFDHGVRPCVTLGWAGLAWATIDDRRIRLGTLAVLAMFALKTWVRRKDVLHPDEKDVEM